MGSPFLRKIFLCLSYATLLYFVFLLIRDLNNLSKTNKNGEVKVLTQSGDLILLNEPKYVTGMKYILQWTSPRNVPLAYMGKGQEGFTSRDCPYQNCYVTGDKKYFNDITNFDVVIFSGPEVVTHRGIILPSKRAPHQKYVFASIESSHYYPACTNKYDGYFNWTWTFRLDSEVRWGYLDVRDSKDNLIGPNKVMHWLKLEEMDPVSEEFKQKLKTKNKAAAWFVSNCRDKAGRMKVAKELKDELETYGLELDIYGKCGTLKCSASNQEECLKMVEETYYFYLSFENSFSEDYVTEKLLQPLRHNAVPIVYGAANYTRFAPDGAYLNAKELGVTALAAKMAEIIRNPEQYTNFFRWKNHYSYHHKHDRPETDEYCKMCEILNNEEKLKETTIIQNFREWWDSPDTCSFNKY
ncbi:alpha-(1,3)-fucosyltransferase C-like isoform X1 [Ostrinia furnacalis]|uniref:alpha-(1,3)-fucosyltransferase C-like isoform X1 n=1 Tax=Ostrinia furnacalis TaxID=93504 RepID=UPI00103BD243|nr:alpha-(1,3)-fucosyltransferase C-like isoform X1 [Ostrinia furnacalis]